MSAIVPITGVFDYGTDGGHRNCSSESERFPPLMRVNRRLHELPYAGNDGHDGNIDITAGDGKDVVAADR